MSVTPASRRQISVLRNMRRKKYRQEQLLFLAEGERTVIQILENGIVDVVTIFLDETNAGTMLPLIEHAGEERSIYSLPRDIFTEVSDTEHPQGILALCRVPEMSDLEVWQNPHGCLVALDGLRDPGNMGTIIRTASWFGASGLILSRDTVDPFHPKVVRSTAGATGTLPYSIGELNDLLRELQEMGWKIFFLEDRQGAEPIGSGLVVDGAVLVIGNEARGISVDQTKVSGRSIRIPMGANRVNVESLNAAVAASIALYEFMKK
ncbi:MAG TPA: RNA methyltransferase [Balneolales bacterium]|nr:RNA methyltransferase [Balneolales bacterium]